MLLRSSSSNIKAEARQNTRQHKEARAIDKKQIQADIVVVGGGVSGVIAACAAASHGASVALIEKEIYLGGISVGALMGQFVGCGLDSIPCFSGISKDIVDELFKKEAAAYYEMPARTRSGNILLLRYNVETLGQILESMVQEAHVKVFFSTQFLEASEDGHGCHLTAVGINTVYDFECSYIVDATGSAAVAYAMGADTRILPVEDRMPSALIFKVGNVDVEKLKQFDWVKVRKPWFDEGILPAEHLALATVPNSNEVLINATNYCPFDEESSEDVTRVVMILEQQIQRLFPIFKERVPGMENAYITAIARKLGVREARRIVGDYVFTADELLGESAFDDAVAVGAWPVDRNMPDGSNVWTETKKPYQIPFRALIPTKTTRLIIAGRSISTDDTVYSATRVIPCTMGIGQAAGEAVGIAWKTNTLIPALDGKKISSYLKEHGIKLNW